MIVVYDRSFIVMACVIMIINYDPKSFIVQATGGQSSNLYLKVAHFFNTSVN